MNVTCSATNVCTTILNSSCVYYTGADLIYTGILTNDNLTTILEKINAKFQDAGLGYIFQNGITQATPGAAVRLGGVLTNDTTITSSGFDLTITEKLIVGSVAITGGLPTEFLKADGSVDNTAYQTAGNYITDLTGDGTASGPGSAALTLATVNYSPGVFGNATHVPVVTVNAKGLVTSVTSTAINLPPTLASFSGDLTGIGNIDTPITLTLNTINSNVYGSNTFLRFAVNGKGLVTSATPVTAGNIYGVLGYTPVPNSRTITINGVTRDLTANRSWVVDSLPPQTGNYGKWLMTDGVSPLWLDLYGNVSQFVNDAGYITNIPTLNDVLTAGNIASIGMTILDLTCSSNISTNTITSAAYTFPNTSSFGEISTVPRSWNFPDASGIIPLSVNGITADYGGDIVIPIGSGTVTNVVGTGSVSGITLSGDITTNGYIVLSGSLSLTYSDVIGGLGYTPYSDANPNGFITTSALSPYITSADVYNIFYPNSNPNGFITINSIYGADAVIGYNNGAIYINSGYYVPLFTDITNWNTAYNFRIESVTNYGDSGSAYYDYFTKILNIPEYSLAGLGGISADFLSATGPILSYNSGTGVIAHNTTDGYLHVPATGTTNNGKFLKAGATAGSLSWATVDLSLQSILNTNHDLVNDLNFQGTDAGNGNTGTDDINGFGNNAATSNSGTNVNALGKDGARNNSGSHVNALGNQAGFNNTYSYVNLLGKGAAATSNNQTVLAGQTYSARLSYNSLTANVTHTLPNTSGTYVLSVNGQTANNSGAVTVPTVTSVTGVGTVSGLTLSGTVTSTGNLTLGGTLVLTSGQVTTALGFTPYDASNPSSYISRTGISSTATGLTYTNTTGVFSLTSGYSIPTNASQTNWDIAYNNRVTSVGIINGTGISASVANPTTTPVITITNTAPDQTVVLNNGTGIAITGTYPNFTITNTAPSTASGTVTNVSASVPLAFSVAVTNPTTTPNIAITALGDASQYIKGDGTLGVLPTPPPAPSGGISTLNGLTANTQFFGTGTSGLDFNVDSSTATHTFNLPDASATARGVITTGAQTIAGAKTFSSTIVGDISGNAGTATSAAKWTTARTLAGNSVDGSVNVNFANKFIVQTADAGLPNAQSLGSLSASGLLKNVITSGTGVLYVAQPNVDYLTPNSVSSYSGTNVRVITYDNNGLITGGSNASAANLTNGTIGTGAIVLANTPTLITPNIGVATGTSLSVTGQLTSTIATGTAPLVVSSTTQVTNLNAERAGTAVFLANGVAGAIPYQTAAGTTSFSNPTATAGFPLLSGANGVGQPSYGVLGIAAGGTGQTDRQSALNTLAGSVTANRFLKGDGSNIVMGQITTSDIPAGTYNISIIGTATGITGTQDANKVYAGPTSGGAASPTFRALVAGDIPTLNQDTTGSAGSISANNVITRANLTNGIARSVMGVAGNATTSVADIQSSATDQVLVSTATSIGWGTVNTAGITNKAVTIGKIQDINTNVILGRTTASSGDIEQLTPTDVTAMLNVFTSSLKGLVPASGGGTTNFLRADGSWAAVNVGYTVETKTANTTYTTASGELIVLVDNGSNNVTITIPNANASTAKITIKKIGTSTAFDLIIATSGGTIDGDTSINLKLALQYTSVTLVSNGTNWFII